MRLFLALIAGLALTVFPAAQSYTNYVSPYFYVPAVTDPALTPDFDQLPRSLSNSNNWSLTPHADWTNYNVIEQLHSTWGPYYISFPAPPDALKQDGSWGQLRVAAAANRIRGIVPYAHHHMHVWDVPNAAPWTNGVSPYTPGVGIDCSDFTHWIYSYGLGVGLKTAVATQGETTNAPFALSVSSPYLVKATRLFDVQHGYTKNFTNLVSKLLPGDLLYIRSDPGFTNPVSHVIIWLGSLAYDTNKQDLYLITDSHGQVVIDSNKKVIPSGPQIRPFRINEYYFGSFDHVLRFIPLTPP